MEETLDSGDEGGSKVTERESPTARRSTYVAYMLRMWQAGSREGQPIWRASLEDPHTGERLAFADVAALLAFLSEWTRPNPAAPAESENVDRASTPPRRCGQGS